MMRVVIDGLSIGDDLAEITALERLLNAWPWVVDGDELHVVVAEERAMRVPDQVIVHRVRRGSSPLHRRVARAVALPRLCRRLRAHALLDGRRSIRLVPLPCPRLDLGVLSANGADVSSLRQSTWSLTARRLHVA